MKPPNLTLTLTPPPAFTIFQSLNPPQKTLTFHQFSTLLITFIAYASFHASRKPPSIVKSVLDPDPNPNPTNPNSGWPPFNSDRGTQRLGELDLAFLSAYAIGMYVSGHVGDRIDVRVFLTIGMIGSGVFTVMFGLGFWFDVHLLGYFVVVQICCGVFQSIGWPCVVAVMGNWFGKSKRGLIMGVWNSHTSVGNIVGSVVASSVLGFGWGWAFLLPGVLIVVVSSVVFGFLVVSPESIGLELPGDDGVDESVVNDLNAEGIALVALQKLESEEHDDDDDDDDIEGVSSSLSSSTAIGFLEAWKLPGVALFAFCLFFSKLVAYTFLYWLPFYIRHTAVAGVQLSHKTAGILSTIFDIGGVVGGILAGYISDLIDARAVTSITFLTLSVPVLVLYRIYGSISMFSNIFLMFLSGLLVNGPYALITTAVAADLGTQTSIKGNSRALATVSAIIDGTGSVGAALGPLLAGYISTRGWNSVFFMLILSLSIAGLLLVRVVRSEIKEKVNAGKWLWFSGIVH